MAVTTGTRPADIDGCWASWSESQEPNVIRTEMDATGYIKTRRRTTGIMRVADVSRTFEATLYQSFLDWYNIACQQGVVPTKVMTPYGKEEIWRFTEPPQITWPDTKAFTVSCKLEQLPGWR